MESVITQINSYFGKYIDLSAISKFITEHKLAVIASSSVAIYGLWFLKRPKNLPPGPYGYPLVGYLPSMLPDFSGCMKDIGKTYGDVCCLWLGSNRYIVVFNNYSSIKEAYVTRGSDFIDRDPDNVVQGLTNDDTIFIARYDNTYKASRKIAAQAFRNFLMTNLDSVIDDEMAKVTASIQLCEGLEFDLLPSITKVFTNVIVQALFAKNFQHDDTEFQHFIKDTVDWNDTFILRSFELIPNIPSIVHNDQMKKGLSLTKNIIRRIEMFCEEWKANPKRKDNITCVFNAYLNDDKLNLSHTQIVDTLMTLMPDGVTTSVHMCNWMFIYLLRYPQYQDKIYQEIMDFSSSSISHKDRPYMPITESFIMEVFRMVTPFPVSVPTKPMNDTIFRGYDIPKDCKVMANIVAVHYDPSLFPEPEVFKPERFIEEGKIVHTEGLIPFGIGRRMCVGEPIARNEIFLFLINMIQRYNISTSRDGLPSLKKQDVFFKAFPYKVQLENRTSQVKK